MESKLTDLKIEIMEKLKLVHQLFIGKVADEIGMERTTELLKQAKEAFAIPVVVQQREQLFCGVEGGVCPYEESDHKCRAEHKCINQVAK